MEETWKTRVKEMPRSRARPQMNISALGAIAFCRFRCRLRSRITIRNKSRVHTIRYVYGDSKSVHNARLRAFVIFPTAKSAPEPSARIIMACSARDPNPSTKRAHDASG